MDVNSVNLDGNVGDGVALAGIQPVLGGLIIAQSVVPFDGTLIRSANVSSSDLIAAD